jgi:aspartate/methionine/tyrosine aminotransferase
MVKYTINIFIGQKEIHMTDLFTRAEELNIRPFIVMDILDRAKQLAAQGRDIIRMEIGEPDFDTPQQITDAAIKALESGETRYSPSQGILPLREAIAEKYHAEYGVDISPDRIIITSGSSAAMTLLFSLTLAAGDEVLLTDPYYPCYPNFLKLYRARPVFAKLHRENEFRVCPDDIAQALTPQTRAVILASPANPTGQLVPDTVWQYLADSGLTIFADEIYHGLVYGKKARSVLEFTDNAFVINGFSKLYAMTGWRLGYIIAPRKWISLLNKGHQNFFIAANTFVQIAGLAALKNTKNEIESMVKTFHSRRDHLLRCLNSIGLPPGYIPDGAFYLLVNMGHINKDSLSLAQDMLEKAGVALAPGSDFGTQAQSYLRFSYSASEERITEAVKRISQYMHNQHKMEIH